MQKEKKDGLIIKIIILSPDIMYQMYIVYNVSDINR